MRAARVLNLVMKIERLLRGYRPLPRRPAPAVFEAGFARVPAGAVISGPFGARSRALDRVRGEVWAGRYVTEQRLEGALERLIARL